MRIIVLFAILFTLGCTSTEPALSHTPVFTLPFARGDTFGVAAVDEHRVSMASNTPHDLKAPEHVSVLAVYAGEVVLSHWEEDAILVVDDLDVVWATEGEKLCAGDRIGRTQRARVSAYWGKEETTDQSDISTVRVVRGAVITDLSKVELSDAVGSTLGETNNQRSTDVNGEPCPYTTEGEQE